MEEWQSLAALRSKLFRNHKMARIINHTYVHCSEVGFIVPLISGMFQVELTLVSASSCLHRDMAITVGFLLSTWSVFVMNRCKYASAVFSWNFFYLREEFLSFCSIKLRYLGWDFSMPPSSFTAISGSVTWDFPSYMYRNCIHSSAG